MWFRRREKSDPAEVSRSLRAQALEGSVAELGVSPTAEHPRVWGILMETGYPEAVATLATFVDGTASLYFSSGGGVIGAGDHESVQAALPGFFQAVESHLDRFTATTSIPLPSVGRVRFYIRTFSGTLTSEAAEDDLGEMRHVLSEVFHAGHEVIGAIREASGDG